MTRFFKNTDLKSFLNQFTVKGPEGRVEQGYDARRTLIPLLLSKSTHASATISRFRIHKTASPSKNTAITAWPNNMVVLHNGQSITLCRAKALFKAQSQKLPACDNALDPTSTCFSVVEHNPNEPQNSKTLYGHEAINKIRMILNTPQKNWPNNIGVLFQNCSITLPNLRKLQEIILQNDPIEAITATLQTITLNDKIPEDVIAEFCKMTLHDTQPISTSPYYSL